METHSGVPQVLLVEDNPGDVRLVQEALKEARVDVDLRVARDGVEAMQLLKEQAPTPDLILLDLNLPRMDGRELLAEIKGDGGLRRIPIVVLTSSQAEADVLKSYNLHANCYIVKPIDYEHVVEVLSEICHFWLQTVRLPDLN